MSRIRPFLNKHFEIHPVVFFVSAFLILLFIGITLAIGEPARVYFERISTEVTAKGGWFLILGVNVFLLVCAGLALSPLGNLRLGGQEAKSDFSRFAWFAMLFSAGMGIGLLFFSVAEPITHFSNPPLDLETDRQKAIWSMKYTFLHYGLHAWSIYAIVGISLAYFTFNKKLPLTIRSVFYPLIGNKIHSRWGDLIDIIAVLATLFGLATSLGFGAQQINSGLNYLFNIPVGVGSQVVIIALITGVATISVVLGIQNGVRVLSELNMRLAALFLVLMLFVGPTVHILDSIVQNTGAYFSDIVRLGTWTETYSGTDWQHDWTTFYWAWWISWSPFVGMFIARISKGRTVREFILSVLIVPSLVTFIWHSTFGNSALFLEMAEPGIVSTAVNQNLSTALFVMLQQFPFSMVTSVVGIILVSVFFVTSSDSGSLVIDSITSGGMLDAPVGQRIFWATTEGAVAATLLVGGGLAAMQTAAVSIGLPFTLLLLIMCYSVIKEMMKDYGRITTKRTPPNPEKIVPK